MKSAVHILSGATSTVKRVEITGLSRLRAITVLKALIPV
jgi:uncharacterized protein YggU (UPF0235/DUF167 family)